MNKDQVVDKLMTVPQRELAVAVYNMHKDQYGAGGHHVLRYSVPELVSWILAHYEWSEKDEQWLSKTPLDDILNFVEETVH